LSVSNYSELKKIYAFDLIILAFTPKTGIQWNFILLYFFYPQTCIQLNIISLSFAFIHISK